jgi:quinolinate synthase
LGAGLLILGHHYQRAAVLRHADAVGDSLELSRRAAGSDAGRIVFCGVRFMAESADILTGPGQTVYMPETMAGCPMSDMADLPSVERAWAALQQGGGARWTPVVYVNSSAEVKAFCGRHGGIACTSSNARRVLESAFGLGNRVLFLPDEHLGDNTADQMGLPRAEIAAWDPAGAGGTGAAVGDIRRARLVLWKGFCLVHTVFTAEHVRAAREKLPGAKIIVHPEVPLAVARLADARGSTSQIIRYVREAPDGSTVVVGTETNLVQRLAEEQRGRVTVKALHPSVCANMARTSERNLLSVLEEWDARRVIRVPPDIAAPARLTLERMLAL